MTNIGTRIKERREELGMSQDELAIKMGYKSRSTIAKIEKGVNDVVQSNIMKFAEVLSTSPAYLMGLVNEETSKKNSTITDIIVRMRKDDNFFSLLETLYDYDDDKITVIKQLLSTLVK